MFSKTIKFSGVGDVCWTSLKYCFEKIPVIGLVLLWWNTANSLIALVRLQNWWSMLKDWSLNVLSHLLTYCPPQSQCHCSVQQPGHAPPKNVTRKYCLHFQKRMPKFMSLNLKMAKLRLKTTLRDDLQTHALCIDGLKIGSRVLVHGIKIDNGAHCLCPHWVQLVKAIRNIPYLSVWVQPRRWKSHWVFQMPEI